MTGVPIDQLTDLIRRDQWGRMYVVPPGGGKPEGYTRVTTVAKALDEGGGLAPWKATMTAAGIIMRPGLRAQWEALLARTGGDPWYATTDSKAEARKLVEDCAAVGGADDRRQIGSSLHTITALIDQGHLVPHLSDETERDIAAYTKGLAQNEVTIASVDGRPAVEMSVVLDAYKVAGTFDRLVNVPGFDLPLIADLKTGANLAYSWQSIAVQLAAYSRGEALYVQGAAKDGSQDQRLPMPAVDQHWGLILGLNAGQATLELFLVDLAAGWEAFAHSMWARNWRKGRPAEPFKPGDMTGRLQASLDKVSLPAEATPDSVSGDSQLSTRIRAWLQGRIDDIGTQSADARAALAFEWRELNVPTLNASTAHTPEQLDAIEALLDRIECRYSIGFPVAKPTEPHDDTVARVVSLFPGTVILNEQGEQSNE